jgi:transcriptional antiterminator RfaH
LGFWKKSSPVKKNYLSIQPSCNFSGPELLPPRILTTGDAVKISGGPFANFVATVEEIGPDQRVWVLLDLMGRTKRVAVQPEAVQAI